MSRNQKIAVGGGSGLFLLAIYYEPTFLVLVVLGLGYYFLIHRPWKRQHPRRLAFGVIYAELMVILALASVEGAYQVESQPREQSRQMGPGERAAYEWYQDYLGRDISAVERQVEEQAGQIDSLTQQIETCQSERLLTKARADALIQQGDACQKELSNLKTSLPGTTPATTVPIQEQAPE